MEKVGFLGGRTGGNGRSVFDIFCVENILGTGGQVRLLLVSPQFFFRDWWEKGTNYFEVGIYVINNSREDRSFDGRLDFVGFGFPNHKNTDTQLKIHQKTAACSPPAKKKPTSSESC